MADPAPGDVTVFLARRILTMNPEQPVASVVAVRDGRILGAGALDDLRGWLHEGRFQVDRQFEQCTILPGFIDAHMHAQMLGRNWQDIYLGFHPRERPDGSPAPGSRSLAEVLDRLRHELSARDDELPVTGWGLDPALLPGVTITARDLDAATGDRPVLLRNTSGHISYANSALLRIAGIDRRTNVAGVVKDLGGDPTGELREIEAMALVGPIMAGGSHEALVRATWDAARMSQRAGCTTISDWAFGGVAGAFQAYQAVADHPDCPVDIVLAPFYRYLLARGGGDMAEGVKVHRQLQSEATGRLKVGPVKLMVDGSIQGFTGDLKWPGYYNGAVNHLENTSLAELTSLLRVIHNAGLQATIHTNGDGASEKALIALQQVLTESPRPGHRHRLEHLQMVTRSQLETMAALGVAGNIFPVHIYYWGDFHRTQTLGPDRARRMDSAAAAKRAGVRVSFHSDAPVTPVSPLFSAWCAAARETSSGFVLGPEHRVAIEDALAAITIEAAYLLHQDQDKGSIETGKLADFTVLDRDPGEAGVDSLRDINVLATVKSGRVFAATSVAV
jgi:hypothetical protein